MAALFHPPPLRLPLRLSSQPIASSRPIPTSSSTPPPPWSSLLSSSTIHSLINQATSLFSLHQTPEPHPSALHLAHFCFPHISSLNFSVTSPPASQLSHYISLCSTRAARQIPIQYLVGHWDFHDITLKTRTPVLIPRPETEELVDHVLRDMTNEGNVRVVDVGIGSGCVLLALLNARSTWHGVGVDISDDAINLAKENINRLGLAQRASVAHGGVAELSDLKDFDVVVANPPYVRTDEMDGLEFQVKYWEDWRALCGGDDGLDVVRDILKWAANGGAKKGAKIWMEVGEEHPERLETMEWEGIEWGGWEKDLSGRPRFVWWRVKEQS